jgi:hypothetical protein
MEIDEAVKVFGFQPWDQLPEVLFVQMDLRDIRICLEQRNVLLLGEEVDLCLRKLLFQAADNGGCQDDVADGTEPDD